MRRAIGEVLRAGKLAMVGSLARRASARQAAGHRPPAFLSRWLATREDRLFAALGGAMSFAILRAAHDVGLFALLHESPGLSDGQIADRLGLGAYPTRILLLGLVPMRLVERVDDRYYNDPILSGLLAGTAEDGALGQILDYFAEVVNPAMLHLPESVRRGEPVGLHRLFGEGAKSFYEALGQSPRVRASFQKAMEADTRMNRDLVAASAAFAGRRRILDVGGNRGELALAIAARHPGVHVTVLDYPAVAEQAKERLAREGPQGRLDAVGGDLLNLDLPSGYDGVLFAHFLDIFSPGEVLRFLRRAFDCLPGGGTVCVVGSAMADDERGPLTHGVLSSYFLCLADGKGRFYTAAQMSEAMRAAGFTDIERTALPRSEVLLRGVKPLADSPARSATSSKLAAFVKLGRPEFLAYSLLLYGLGSAAVAHAGRPLDLARWAHGLFFVWSAHLMTHYCNEHFDLRADRENRAATRWTGGSRVLVEGRLRPSTAFTAALMLLFVGLWAALMMPAPEARWIALGALALGWFYTAPPLALNYRGLGEITVAAVLNLAVPLIAFTLGRGSASPATLLAITAPLVVAQAARMLVMNLADHDADRRVGKRTLAVVLGPRRARAAIVAGQVVVYAAILALTLGRVLPAIVGGAMLLVSPLAIRLALRLLAGQPWDRAQANDLAFWASTQVALLAAAATIGLVATCLPLASSARVPSLALCAAIVAAYGVILALQIRRHLAEARR